MAIYCNTPGCGTAIVLRGDFWVHISNGSPKCFQGESSPKAEPTTEAPQEIVPLEIAGFVTSVPSVVQVELSPVEKLAARIQEANRLINNYSAGVMKLVPLILYMLELDFTEKEIALILLSRRLH